MAVSIVGSFSEGVVLSSTLFTVFAWAEYSVSGSLMEIIDELEPVETVTGRDTGSESQL
jgi:hypothetical protein